MLIYVKLRQECCSAYGQCCLVETIQNVRVGMLECILASPFSSLARLPTSTFVSARWESNEIYFTQYLAHHRF